MAGAVGVEPTPRVLETRLYGFEDRCATITLSPYKNMAGIERIELPSAVLETVILPLN